MLDLKAIEPATVAAFNALYPDARWDALVDRGKDQWRGLVRAAIEEYQRQTLRGYAEKIEKKGVPKSTDFDVTDLHKNHLNCRCEVIAPHEVGKEGLT